MSRAWMPFYPGDYLADTNHLSTVEHGAYLLLIWHYWQKGSLPDDDRQLARIVRLPAVEWLEIKATVAEFFSDGWRHKRIERELATAEERYQRRAAAGRKGGRPSVNEPELPGIAEDAESNALALLNQPQPQPQPHSDPDQRSKDLPPPHSTTPVAQGRGGVSLEMRLREAAGLVGVPGTGLKRTGPIMKLIGEGYSLEGAILPALRACAADGYKAARSWAYFVEPIRRWTGPVLSASPVSQVSVWIAEGSPEWRAWRDHELAHGRDPPRGVPSRNGLGWSFKSQWPPGHDLARDREPETRTG